jgi:hypothetical protein
MIRKLWFAVGIVLPCDQALAVPPVAGREGVRSQANVRCVKDSFGNYSCSDGSRVIRDSAGNVTVIPGRK